MHSNSQVETIVAETCYKKNGIIDLIKSVSYVDWIAHLLPDNLKLSL